MTSHLEKRTDTICAIATAPGGAIGIVRVSGFEAIDIVERVFSKPLHDKAANTVTFGLLKDSAGEVVDEVLVNLFRAPHSYTGEDAVEISCHGSRYILQRVVQMLIDNGCRQANPGEYTLRAYLNGKMDLSQAEAVADLIASQTSATHHMAINQMRGTFSSELAQLREKLLHLTTLMELELDFSDHEDLEFADRSELRSFAADIAAKLTRLADSFRLGNALKNGMPIAIVGEANAGKSTLLNAFVGEERSIVSDVKGTTRDFIEEAVNIDGVLFRFIDTAGIRQTADEVEQLGIERTYRKISEAEMIIWVVDAVCAEVQIKNIGSEILPLCRDKDLLVLLNKTDLLESETFRQKLLTDARKIVDKQASSLLENSRTTVHVEGLSANDMKQANELLHSIASSYICQCDSIGDTIVSNMRHYASLTRSLDSVQRVLQGLASQVPTDLVAQDLRECISEIAEITGGEITTPETLSNIFSHFCVGK